MSDEQNPVLVYADSYRTMARIARAEGQATTVDMFSVVTDLERNIAPLWSAERLRADTAVAEVAALREKLARYKAYASRWEKVAHDMGRSRAESLKKVAEGLQVSVFNTPVPMEALEQLMPCECFQLDQEMLVLHSPVKPTESGSSE